ncbi:transposase [Azonexus hydrophilus]|uniref:transposase n=1 Tax=Azonexus hydrophilus TaxID=418702 RepID=UPI0024927A08|nr:transposase [Azonexus hydrophilus]
MFRVCRWFAGWKPAIRQVGNLRYADADWQSAIRQIDNLRYEKRACCAGQIPYSRAVPEPDANPGLQRVQYALRADGVPAETANRLRSGIHSRGYLPHVKREGTCYFVTFRLADSLPRAVLLQFERQRAEAVRKLKTADRAGREAANRELLRRVERYLDRGVGACHLRRPEIAEMVANALRFFDGQRYHLHEWVVMPNHVHVLVWPMPNHLLSGIVKSWKQFTALRAKRLLGLQQCRFWQPESFDHWIRNDGERARVARYIRNNPMVAGLCSRPEEWRWSSAWRQPATK